MLRKELQKYKYLFALPCAALLLIVLIHERALNPHEIFGAILLAAGYSVLLMYTLLTTNRNAEKTFDQVMWLFLSLFSFGILILGLMRPLIGWDTWQVYDMSKYVFTDFGFMDQIRQHIVNTHYEMAFPPVFPYLMAVVNAVFDLGVNASVYLNSVFLLLCFVDLSKIFKHKHTETIGCIAAAAVFCSSLYVFTYIQGLTQTPGYYLLILLCRIILCKDRYDWRFAVKCGLCCGLMLMNRFDALAIVAVMALAIPFLMYKKCSTKEILVSMILYCCTVLVICSPWIFYSLDHFDSIFITDNGRRLFNIPDTRPSTFFPESAPAPTIRDSFGDWLAAFSKRAMNAVKSFVYCIFRYSVIPEALAVCVFYRKKIKQLLLALKWDAKILSVIALVSGQEALCIATGYSDARYHLPMLFLLQLFALYFLCSCIQKVI